VYSFQKTKHKGKNEKENGKAKEKNASLIIHTMGWNNLLDHINAACDLGEYQDIKRKPQNLHFQKF